MNETNGRTFTLRPLASGVYVIDSAAAHSSRMDTLSPVRLIGTPDYDAIGEMDDEFLLLEPGGNILRTYLTGGVSLTEADVCWVDRF